MSGQQAPRTVKQHGLHDFPKLAAKTKREEKAKGEIHPEIRKIKGEFQHHFSGRDIRWTARAWEGFQHQILKGSPCIAKLPLGF
jgi:hypothetical protein